MSSVRTADGRTLSYCEVGSATGPLVLHQHGGPSSRLEAGLFADAAARLGLRLACVDRPGIGGSTPQRERTFAGWADDLLTVADALGAERFAVTGWSEGGPWALAAAAFLPAERLRHVTVVAGACYGAFGDDWARDELSRADALGGFLALHVRPGFRLLYGAIGLTAEHLQPTYLSEMRKTVSESDREVLDRPGVAELVSAMSAECFAQGSTGLVRDAEILYRQWAFDVTTIERPVHVWQGTADTLVPPVITRTVAQRMPGAVWHPVDGAGHFLAAGRADEILAVVAADLSR